MIAIAVVATYPAIFLDRELDIVEWQSDGERSRWGGFSLARDGNDDGSPHRALLCRFDGDGVGPSASCIRGFPGLEKVGDQWLTRVVARRGRE